VEVDAIEASMCGTYLILCANGFLKQILLDEYCIGSECVLVSHLVFERIKSEKKADCKRRTRAQARSGRQVSYVVNFHSLLDS
jgi:hypothetical protein